MFENLKRSVISLLGGELKGYDGTFNAYKDQILTPLESGTAKNKFQLADAEKVSAAVTCIKVLGDTISRLPINVYQSTNAGNLIDKKDYRYDLLHFSPNGIISSQSFFAALEYNRNLRGNSFARIYRNRETGKVNKLELIPSNLVGGYKIVRGQLYYILYQKKKDNKTKEVVVNAHDILHFKMITKNGIWGINPIEVQRLNLSTIWKGKQTVDHYYENNAFSPKVLQSKIPDAQYLPAFEEAMVGFKDTNVGPVNAGNIIKLPPFTEIQELNLDPIDAKFIESMKFDTTQIAAFYGVPPDMVGVYEYSKYNNVEQAQLNFKANTISAIARMYRQELEMKLLSVNERINGKSIEFVVQALIETDIKTKTEYYTKMFNMGVMTQNQIGLLEGLPTFEDGDKHYMSSQVTSIEDRINQIVDSKINEKKEEDRNIVKKEDTVKRTKKRKINK